MSTSPTNLEIQGSFMRVPPPKELTTSMERRRSTEESSKPIPRRSVTLTNRSSGTTPAPRKNPPAKPETRQSNQKPDDTEAMKIKIGNLEDEIRRLKRRIEELEKEIHELQKQMKTKDKRINELTKENDELKKRVCYSLFVFLFLKFIF
jgi:TolA-binding protein